MHRALCLTTAATLWCTMASAAHAQEGAEEIPPPPPAEEVPPPPPGYGSPQGQPAPQAQPQYPQQQGYPTDGGYYPQQPPPGGYAPPPPDPGRHKHDGFLFRATLGPAYINAGTDDTSLPDDPRRIYGGAIALTITLGGAVAENFVIFGTLWGTAATGPTIEYVDESTIDSDSNVSMSFSGIGAGLTYFIMPINLYLSGALSLATLQLEDAATGLTGESEVGFDVQALVGKEFWVSDNWALGPAIQVGFGSVPDGEEVTFGVFHVGLHFSATYN